MFKPLRNKVLGLASLAATTALLMGACPMDSILNVGQQPASQAARPTIQFVLPNARADVLQGDIISIQWTDTHPAGAATIRLFYDRDGVAGSGDAEPTITTLTESAATTGGTYAWNTAGVAPNVYRLAATIDDQVNPPVTVYLAYEMVIRSNAVVPPAEGMTLNMLTPATTLAPKVGEGIRINWTANDPSHNAMLYLYYDPDVNPVNGNESLIAVVNPGTGEIGSNDYGWTIPDGLNGTYNILGRLHNGVDPDVYDYAAGAVQLGSTGQADAVRDLQRAGQDFATAIFDGYIPNGHLGKVMTGGRDFNGDYYDDFILVAPDGISPMSEYAQFGVFSGGEAYLIYSRGVSGRWPQGQSVSVGGITSYALNGVKFVGPSYTSSTAGITDVMFIDDVDGDNLPEIVFGMADINTVFQDQQDYDPLDGTGIHAGTPPAPAGWTAGKYYFQCPGWQPFSDQPNGSGDDWLVPGMRSGLVAWVSSQSGISNHTVLIDQVGGQMIYARPEIARGMGLKVFPIAGGDDSHWGQKLGTTKLMGNLSPTVMIARPAHVSGAGSIKVMPHDNMLEVTTHWTEADASAVTIFNTAPKCFTFPYADSTPNNNDPDRIPAWPFPWGVFMDPMSWIDLNTDPYWNPGGRRLPPPNASRFDIINSNAVDAANGGLTNPTGLKDFDGDKVEDAAVASPGSLNNTGIAYVVYGSRSFNGMDLSLFRSATARGAELRGTQVGEQLGYKMAGPGNVTREAAVGKSDWLLTAPKRSWSGRTNCGAVILVPGQALLGSYTVDDVVPTLGGAIIYGANTGDQLGMYLTAAGDVDRDGYQDFLVSAPGYSTPDRPHCGAVYLIYGGPHLQGEFDINDIGTANLPGKMYIGPEANAAIGPVAPAGDTDNDYYDDFLIAQPNANAQGLAETGRVWLIYGGLREAP